MNYKFTNLSNMSLIKVSMLLLHCYTKNMTKTQKHTSTFSVNNLQSVNIVMQCFPANNNTFVCPNG